MKRLPETGKDIKKGPGRLRIALRSFRRLLCAVFVVLPGCGNDGPVPAPAVLPGKTVAVVAMGDSLTEGTEDTPGKGGYPGRLQELIEKTRPDWQVTNLGRAGWTSEQLLKRQLPTALVIKPRIAIVWIGSNDLWRFYKAEQQAQDLKNFTANITTVLSSLKDADVSTYIALLDDQSKRPVARTTEIEPYTQEDRDRMSSRVAAYNAAIREQAARYGATTVDFYSTDIFTDPATLASDGNHPNAQGYNLIAEKWYAAIGPALKP